MIAQASSGLGRILTTTIISLIAVIFLFSPWGESLEKFYYDSLFLFRGARNTNNNIVVVAIDEASFDELNLQWPWPRSIHANLINSLKENGAKVIAFDLLFAEPTDFDQELATTINNHNNIVLVNEINSTTNNSQGFSLLKIIDPTPILDLTSNKPSLGFANMPVDGDGFVRAFNFLQQGEKAFSLQIANQFLNADLSAPDQKKLLNYIGPAGSIKSISYYQALDPKTFLPLDYLKDKIILIGFAVASRADLNSVAADQYPTPFSRWEKGVMPGVEIHATAVENFINNNFIEELPKNTLALIGFILGITIGTLMFIITPIIGGITFLIILIIYFTVSFYFFSEKNIFFSFPPTMLPLTLCYLASPVFHYLSSNKERAFIKKAFSTYLSPRLVSELIKNPEKLELGGEEIVATVMFLDIAGFTSLSEQLSPNELISFVNRYLGAFAEEIFNTDGMLDKYIGDCIMAVWGVPLSDPEHANKAVKAVLLMKKKLIALNSTSSKLKDISFRAGITSGKMLAGNVGGGKQFNYTVLGNEVNLASRLESLNKFYGTTILVSKGTRDLLSQDYYLREIDIVRVKGQKKPEVLFELCGLHEEISKEQMEVDKIFVAAREKYHQRNWQGAIKDFEKYLSLSPETKVSNIFISRSQNFLKQAPAQDWDGVYDMQEK